MEQRGRAAVILVLAATVLMMAKQPSELAASHAFVGNQGQQWRLPWVVESGSEITPATA
jgi:hypothetical protein